MRPPLMLPPLDAATLQELRQLYDTTTDARTRLRAQIVLLAEKQHSIAEITVRVHLHAHGYVCKRPTWTLKHKAEEQLGYVGNA